MRPHDLLRNQSIGWGTERIEAALQGSFDPADLEPGERVIYDDLVVEALCTPSLEQIHIYERLGNTLGAVGYNESDQIVRVVPNSSLRILEEADAGESAETSQGRNDPDTCETSHQIVR